ncbi:MAG TPA: hypothetical protein VES97_11765 [Solirubrobacteraceae bacterium]|nr:hypothetical protein [Solirubrobacteraceae bacterium]
MRVDPDPAARALEGARIGPTGWARANCPYCLDLTGKEDRRQSLGIKPSIGFFSCFKCGARGHLPDDFVVGPEKPKEAREFDLGPPPGYEELWSDDAFTSIMLRQPREYLLRRGITRDVMAGAQVGACLYGKLSGRVVVPCFDLDGETWLGFSARDWTDKQDPRYRYPIGMPRAKFLWNQVALYRETDAPALIVEGVFDALPYWPDAVACLGKPGDVHRALMAESDRPLAVCLDGDAWEEGAMLVEFLKLHGRRAGYVRLPPCTDPNTVDRTWLREEAKRCTS